MWISYRDRACMALNQNRWVISAELFVVVALLALELKDFPGILFVFPIVWVMLWLRKLGWKGVGLHRPPSWFRTLVLGALTGVALQLLAIWLIDPLLVQLTGQPFDMSEFHRIQGRLPNLIAYIIIGWLLGAFLEEMVFRGYMINRFTNLFDRRLVGLVVGVLVSSVLFAIGHLNLGISSVVETFLFSLAYSGLYLAAGRNLWLPIISHGVYNMTFFVLVYFGYNPSWVIS
jgi:membrane protease YdiL (CAAX protease family)